MVKNMARQGDLLFVRHEKLPVEKNKLKAQNGNILAFGEVTGHSHKAVYDDGSGVGVLDVVNDEFATKVVESDKPWTATHDEHNKISFAKGIWEIRRQVEYQPQGLKMVVD